MTRTLLVAFLLFVAVPASAQTVELHLDLSGLGWGYIEVEPVDLDGDRATAEFLITGGDKKSFRIVTERNGAYCIGDWFTPTTPNKRADSFLHLKVVNVGGVVKLMATEYWGWNQGPKITQLRFDLPVCH
jgi:hypothetical protein